jgi:hypothetical protein
MPINQIPEFKEIISLLRQQKRDIAATKRRLEKKNSKYIFLKQIFKFGSDGQFLERQIAELFKEIGYKNVNQINFPTDMPDIEITVAERLTCIEVKSSKRMHETENELLQVNKYKVRRQDDLPNLIVKGILIFNNDNQQIDITLRDKNPFDANRERDAKLNGYSLISTTELTNGFILLKKNEISFEQFDKIIHRIGIVKFSKRHIKKVLSEE